MGHLANAKEELYEALAERLKKTPESTVINEELMSILHHLYTETEAAVGSKMPALPSTLDKIAAATGMDEGELAKVLDEMSFKGLILDIPRRDTTYYALAPVVVGFFEYTFMRTGSDIKLKELAEFFDEYFNSEGAMEKIAGVETKMMRSLVYEQVMPLAVETEVLDYEKASEIIHASGGGAVSLCSCRHQASHLGTACDAPQEVCISLGKGADWIIRKGLGKPATEEELLQILKLSEEHGLVHLCDNVMNNPTYICNCCGCCCHILNAVNEKQVFAAHPSNFEPTLLPEACISCGICAEKCPIHVIAMTDDGSGTQLPVVNYDSCIGCGVCASSCPAEALQMTRRAKLHVPPKDIPEKLTRMAMEKH